MIQSFHCISGKSKLYTMRWSNNRKKITNNIPSVGFSVGSVHDKQKKKSNIMLCTPNSRCNKMQKKLNDEISAYKHTFSWIFRWIFCWILCWILTRLLCIKFTKEKPIYNNYQILTNITQHIPVGTVIPIGNNYHKIPQYENKLLINFVKNTQKQHDNTVNLHS